MAIPDTVIRFLNQHKVHHDVVRHPHTASSWQSVISAHVKPSAFAKAVVLRDAEGYFLAVVPASHRLDLGALEQEFGRRPELVTEADLARLFPDCELGAVPALGPAYGLDSVVDSSLKNQPEVFLEAGDHEDIIRLDGVEFARVMEDAWFGDISKIDDS